MKHFLVAISLILCSLTSLASQPQVPITTPYFFRITIGPDLATDFSGLNHARMAIDFSQRLGGGFEWGTTLHAGAASEQLFVSDNTLAVLGLNLMGRYFGEITNVFYLGLQLDMNYSHNLSSLGKTGVFGVRLSAPLVSRFERSVAVYLAPGIRAEGAMVDTSACAASVFAKSLGASLEFGAMFYTYGPAIYVSARPTWPDVRALSVVTSDFSLGLAFDI